MLILPTVRQHYYYPTSDTFINPYYGQPAPEMAAFLTPFISKMDDEVDINLGDCPADVMQIVALQYLSPVIRVNPNASVFKMRWSASVPNYSSNTELVYDRTKGQMTVMEVESRPGMPLIPILLGKYLTDRDIYQAAQSNLDYEAWAKQHWKN